MLKNKTIKNKSKKKLPSSKIYAVNKYNLHFKGTDKIPITKIIKYVKQEILDNQSPSSDHNHPSHMLTNWFDTQPLERQLKKSKNKPKFTLNITLNPLKDTLDKLLSYTLINSNSFINLIEKHKKNITEEMIAKQMKENLNADLSRNYDHLTINNNEFKKTGIIGDPPDKENAPFMFYPDIFYSSLAAIYMKNKMNIDYNNINRMSIIFTQAFLINTTRFVLQHISKTFEPESIMGLSTLVNDNYIEIDKNTQKMTTHYASKIMMSEDGFFDPDNVAGVIDYVFVCDLLKNTYQLSVVLKYDKNGYDDSKDEFNPKSASFSKQKTRMFPNNVSTNLLIATGISTAGVITTPFLLGLLGGNKKKTLKKRKY
uniref:Uncharacterized protein n=1 Tax=viral metagenome TaxID=1070528 RepID=A0A6C0LJ91_9ZZZZ